MSNAHNCILKDYKVNIFLMVHRIFNKIIKFNIWNCIILSTIVIVRHSKSIVGIQCKMFQDNNCIVFPFV